MTTDATLAPIPALATLGIAPSVRQRIARQTTGLVVFAGPDMDVNRETMLAALREHRERHEAVSSFPHFPTGILSRIDHELPRPRELIEIGKLSREELDRYLNLIVVRYGEPDVIFTDMDLTDGRVGRMAELSMFGYLTFACVEADDMAGALMRLWQHHLDHQKAKSDGRDGDMSEARWVKEYFWKVMLDTVVHRRRNAGDDVSVGYTTEALLIDEDESRRLIDLPTSAWPEAIRAMAS